MRHIKPYILFIITAILTLHLLHCMGNAEPYGSLMKKGDRYYKRDLYRDALGYYLEGNKKNRKALEPYFNIGTASYKTEQYIQSIEAFSKALQLTDNEERIADIQYNLGNNYFQMGDYQKAAQHYREGLEHNPYDLNMKYNLELALKKMAEKNPPPDTKKESQQKKKENNKTHTPEEKTNTAEKLPEKGELSPDEAERLINSVNNDQSKIFNDILQKRAGAVKNEKDW